MEKSYKHVPLIKKLGIKIGMRIIIINSPDNFERILGKLPEKVLVADKIEPGLDYIHFFTKSQKALLEIFTKLKDSLSKDTGMLWISWPKGACNVSTDLNENIIRAIGLRSGMVDVKICSIDQTWSALKFVFRKKSVKS